MMNEENDISYITGTPIEKDWGWWSYFLQRNYYGSEDEMPGWSDAAASIARALDVRPGMRLLDLGSGCGEMVIRLAMRGADATGIEQSEPLVEYCRKQAAARGVHATFIPADMFTFEPEGTFDAIISLNTSFGYGSDEQNRELVERMGRWLRPGGAVRMKADRRSAT